jgi:hypothetical protein
MIACVARFVILAGTFAASAIAAAPSANAESKFDGRWTAVLETKSGPCDPAYRGAVQVINGTVEVEGASNALSGRVLANGSVTVTGAMGAFYGVAWGRLSLHTGRGRWRAHLQNGNCFGVWTARRLMSR